MIPERVVDFDADDAVTEMLGELEPFISRAAAGITHSSSFIDDLVQSAAIELWQLDPTRFDAGDMPYVRAALFKHMHNVARAERAALGIRQLNQDNILTTTMELGLCK